MNTYILSKLLRNSVWITLALLCAVLPPWYMSGSAHTFSLLEAGILAGMILLSITAVDSLGATDDANDFSLSRSLATALVTTVALFLLSVSQGLFLEQRNSVLLVLFLFILFRCLAGVMRLGLRYPEFLSSGVLVLGSGPSTKTVKQLIENSKGRYRMLGQISYDGTGTPGQARSPEELLGMARRVGVDKLIVAFPERRGTMPVKDIMRCRMQGITVMDVPSFYESVSRKLYIETLTPSWFIFSSGFSLSLLRRGAKRISDILAAVAGLILSLPFFPLVALLIKLDSPGPVFFHQTRTGLGGRAFTIIKLRTMRRDAERKTGACWAGEHDPRITRIGRFLRKTRLDEIPQLVNVLLGHMSLIGPRPERPEFIQSLEREIPFYSERHCVKPGITGWAQVCYPYGSSVEDALEKLRFDLYYIKNQSFLLDLEIVLRTIGVVLLGRGAR